VAARRRRVLSFFDGEVSSAPCGRPPPPPPPNVTRIDSRLGRRVRDEEKRLEDFCPSLTSITTTTTTGTFRIFFSRFPAFTRDPDCCELGTDRRERIQPLVRQMSSSFDAAVK